MKKQIVTALLATAAILAPMSASAEILMKIEGISGASSLKGYEGWINVDGLSENMTREVSLSDGAKREVGMPMVQEINIFRQMDNSSTELRTYFASGKIIPEVTFAVLTSPEQGEAVETSSVVLKDVIITNISSSYGEESFEGVNLSFSRITWKNPKIDPSGKVVLEKSDQATFNLITGKLE